MSYRGNRSDFIALKEIKLWGKMECQLYCIGTSIIWFSNLLVFEEGLFLLSRDATFPVNGRNFFLEKTVNFSSNKNTYCKNSLIFQVKSGCY